MKNFLFNILLPLLFLNNISNCQNLITNGGFELKRTNAQLPDDQAQADNLANWDTRTSNEIDNGVYFHSPDWTYNGLGDNQAFGSSEPYMGSGLLGMAQYELIQQKLDGSNLSYGRKYRLTYHIKRSNFPTLQFENCILKIFLMRNKFKYNDENNINIGLADLCNEDYRTQSNANELLTQPILVHEKIINQDVSANSWVKVSAILDLPLLDCTTLTQDYCGYNWIMLQLENVFEPQLDASCEDGYVYLENISLVEINGCEVDCSPESSIIDIDEISTIIVSGTDGDNSSDFVNDFLNDIFPNWNEGTNPVALAIMLKNAIGYTFEVFSRGGFTVYSRTELNVNGLKDEGFEDYLIQWRGDDPFLNMISFEAYPFTLTAWNCSESIRYDGVLTYVSVPTELPLKPLIGNIYDYTCCPDLIKIQNKIYFTPQTVNAGVLIIAGYDVDSSKPLGNVTFYVGPLGESPAVEYIAPYVELTNGFISGPNFSVTNEDCYNYFMRYQDRSAFLPQIKIIQDKIYEKENNCFVFSNPILKSSRIQIPPEFTRIKLFSIDGRFIGSYENYNFDLSDFKTGLYVVKYLNKYNNLWCSNKLVLVE